MRHVVYSTWEYHRVKSSALGLHFASNTQVNGGSFRNSRLLLEDMSFPKQWWLYVIIVTHKTAKLLGPETSQQRHQGWAQSSLQGSIACPNPNTQERLTNCRYIPRRIWPSTATSEACRSLASGFGIRNSDSIVYEPRLPWPDAQDPLR